MFLLILAKSYDDPWIKLKLGNRYQNPTGNWSWSGESTSESNLIFKLDSSIVRIVILEIAFIIKIAYIYDKRI